MRTQRQELMSSLRDLIELQKIEKRQQDQKLRMKLEEWKTSTFLVELSWNSPNGLSKTYDQFEIEGIDNAGMVVEQYRTLGHSMNLRKLNLYCKGEIVKTINFKY